MIRRRKVYNWLQHRGERPSFWTGIAQIFDFSNILGPRLPGGISAEQSYWALRSDWEAVEQDLRATLAELDALLEAQNETQG